MIYYTKLYYTILYYTMLYNTSLYYNLLQYYTIPYYVTDNKKIKKYYDWQPKKNVDQTVKDIYQWLIKNKKVKKFFK